MINVKLETSDLPRIFGIQDKNLKYLEEKFGVSISARGDQITIEGNSDCEAHVEKILRAFVSLVNRGLKIDQGDLDTFVRLLENDPDADLVAHYTINGIVLPSGREIRAKSTNQQTYLNTIRQKDVVMAIGPAGTGKTYLAMAMALDNLLRGNVKRIVLCRPALEAGEKLGFLPGDLVEKVNPYLRPLYDALYDLTNHEQAQRYIEQEIIEIAPLAFMRGRTLAKAFIILDEAQNTTSEQMKMFLTRIGIGSKAVVTGDITQIDLPNDRISGLVEVQELFADIHEIGFVYFNETDVVRHSLVKKIIQAYEKSGARKKNQGKL